LDVITILMVILQVYLVSQSHLSFPSLFILGIWTIL